MRRVCLAWMAAWGLTVGGLELTAQEAEVRPEEEEQPEAQVQPDEQVPQGTEGPESGAGERVSRCTLQLNFSRSFSENLGRGVESFVHYLGGKVRTRCGDATITSDSAIHYESQGRVEMIGNVHYRDTTRVLQAERLTYYGPEDRVVAEREALLTRLSSGSQLSGPEIEFFRTRRSAADRTHATGRPRMKLAFGAGGSGPEPFEVDADIADFIGEERAAAFGSVEIVRSDIAATADSAHFDVPAGLGRLYGAPVVTGSSYEMTGDSVHALFSGEELKQLRAMGSASATGSEFAVYGPTVSSFLEAEEVRRLTAHGGRVVGLSGRFRVDADSLTVHMGLGGPDSLVAVGEAAAIQTEDSVGVTVGRAPGLPPALGSESAMNWIAGDTLWATFAPAEQDGGRVIETLLARGRARSFYSAVRDSTASAKVSQNYVVGRRIEVHFLDGEVAEVAGDDAIGVYLEPAQPR